MTKAQTIAANRLLLMAMLLAGSYTLMRAVGDSLFLSRVGSDSLAVVFVASGIATAFLALIWYALTRHWSLSKSLKVSGATSAVLTLAAWVALPYYHHSWWLLAAIYLLTELKGCVNTINVVSAANEILGGHSSRKAWARIGLGAPFAGVVVGVMIGIESHVIDVRMWLLLSVAFDLLALLPLRDPGKLMIPKSSTPKQLLMPFVLSVQEEQKRGIKKYVDSRSFRFWIGMLISTKIIVLTLITFFWKVSVTEFYAGDEQSLTRYFGVFYAGVGALTLVLQFFVTGRLLESHRLELPILMMPAGLAILSAALLFGLGPLVVLIVLTLARSFEVWRRSVHDTTLSLLYTYIPREKRRSTISLNTGFIKPLAEVGASLFLLIASVSWRVPAVVVVSVLWFIAALALLRLIAKDRVADPSAESMPEHGKVGRRFSKSMEVGGQPMME